MDGFDFDLQLFADGPVPIDGGDEEEIELPDDTGDEPEGGPPPDEGPEEEMPDELLTDAERAERAATRVREPEAPAAKTPDSAVLAELREIFAPIAATRQEAQPAAQPQRPLPPELQPFSISDEQAARLSEKALSEPGGIAKLIAAAINIGDRRAMARMASAPESQTALQTSAESLADRFVARKLRDPGTKFGKAIEPVFQSMIDDMDLTPLVSMSAADRSAWLEETWERAGFRAITRKAGAKASPSPGVARGAGARPGRPGVGRVVVKLTDSQKKVMRDGSPTLYSGAEGERLFQRHVWEIEHGVTSNPQVRAMTQASTQFGEAVGFGG